MSPRSIVVTGANRGIGLGLVQQFLKNPKIEYIIATARDVEKAEALRQFNDPRVHILPLDVNSDESIDNFVVLLSNIVGEEGLNLLINNAGTLLPYNIKSTISRDILREQFELNTISVVILTQKLLPLLTKAAKNTENPASKLSPSRAAVITISSRLGSITLNNTGADRLHVGAYRMSKAAVNQFDKTLSIELKDDNILVVSLSPGWVKTDLGTDKAHFTVEESTSVLVESIGKLNESHNGGNFDKNLDVFPF